jgi:methionyl-tRNA formyltransferase
MSSFPRIVFVGVHREAEAPLRWLVERSEGVVGLVTLTEEARAGVSGAVELGGIAAAHGVPVLEVASVNEGRCITWTRERTPDVVLVVGWTQLLKTDMLAIPKVACLGFHASLLPRYRGRAPINWALIHGETETGNTMIVLEPGADEGDIVSQRRIAIADEDDCATLYDKVAATEVEMLAEVLPLIRAGKLPRRPQSGSEATVMPKRRPEDGRIDWSKTTRQLFDWVRALTHPYPGAFSEVLGTRLYVWRARRCEGDVAPAVPGSVRVVEGKPLVRTGDGWLEIVRVQLAGEAEVDGTEAAHRFLTDGRRLGDPSRGQP